MLKRKSNATQKQDKILKKKWIIAFYRVDFCNRTSRECSQNIGGKRDELLARVGQVLHSPWTKGRLLEAWVPMRSEPAASLSVPALGPRPFAPQGCFKGHQKRFIVVTEPDSINVSFGHSMLLKYII